MSGETTLPWKDGLRLLKPHLMASGVKAEGKIAIGTVKGDLHAGIIEQRAGGYADIAVGKIAVVKMSSWSRR
jgi:hypothetical protein